MRCDNQGARAMPVLRGRSSGHGGCLSRRYNSVVAKSSAEMVEKIACCRRGNIPGGKYRGDMEPKGLPETTLSMRRVTTKHSSALKSRASNKAQIVARSSSIAPESHWIRGEMQNVGTESMSIDGE
uniref:Uncharacterized protein n=1 Tax=Mantoniella antarctica TaxID=81844 RepID=A0A7S0X247_9CHLO